MGKNLGIEYKMRMPADLKEKVAESAKELKRSMNADIMARLEQTFEPATSITTASTEALISELVNRLPDDGRFIIEKK